LIVLDTHVLIWWVSGQHDLLSRAALTEINAERAGGEILVSSISAWEIAMLVSRGRLLLSMDVVDWLEAVEEIEGVRFVPLENEIAVRSTELPCEFHKDPADRIIVATSRRYAAPLVSADQKLRDYPHARTIW
jgi:PIN domain nuclease of toxin-antitoxin system